MIVIHLAVEDRLSEIVLQRLLHESGRDYNVASIISRGGFGYLKSKIVSLNKSAKAVPFAVLTDLDSAVCPSALIKEWLPNPPHPNLIFRVAVREVEAWLLGDHTGFSKFLKISTDHLPQTPEQLPDPKRTLVEIASRSKKSDIRRRLVPRISTNAKVGREYNDCLGEFVVGHWNPSRAALICPSLARCMAKFANFQPSRQ